MKTELEAVSRQQAREQAIVMFVLDLAFAFAWTSNSRS
jgi:hypothetical protein